MRTKWTASLIFLLTLWSCAVLSPQPLLNMQVITRMALTTSIVDSGSVEISRFAARTGDKAVFNGHFYADKTPGHPFLAVPVVLVDKLIRQALGQSTDADDRGVFLDYVHWSTIAINCVFTAITALVLFLTVERLGANPGAGVFAAFATTLATPLYGWSTAFFAHSVTGSLLLLSLSLVLWMFPPADPDIRPARRWSLLLLGLVLGYTLVVDLTAAPATVIIGLLALHGAWRSRQLVSATLLVGICGIGGLLPLAIYNQIAFGSPLHLGYGDTEFTGMQDGFYGVTWPDPLVALALLFSLYRGLLPLSPVLILVPFGLYAAFRRPQVRPLAGAVTLVILAYLWINSSYYYWSGGWSTGPRHLVAMLPVAGLALAFAWPKSALDRTIVSALLAVSLVLSVASAVAGMYAPDNIQNAMVDWVFKRALDPATAARALLVVPAWLLFAGLLWRASATRTGSAAPPLSPAA